MNCKTCGAGIDESRPFVRIVEKFGDRFFPMSHYCNNNCAAKGLREHFPNSSTARTEYFAKCPKCSKEGVAFSDGGFLAKCLGCGYDLGKDTHWCRKHQTASMFPAGPCPGCEEEKVQNRGQTWEDF